MTDPCRFGAHWEPCGLGGRAYADHPLQAAARAVRRSTPLSAAMRWRRVCEPVWLSRLDSDGCGSGQDHPGQDVLARHVMPVRAAGMLLDGGDELVDLFGLLGAELNAARDAGEDHTSGTEAGLAALAVEGAALDLFEPGTPDA